MLGKANEIRMIVFVSTFDYDGWRADLADDVTIIDVKFGMLPQSQNFQYSYGILVIYKDGESHG